MKSHGTELRQGYVRAIAVEFFFAVLHRYTFEFTMQRIEWMNVDCFANSFSTVTSRSKKPNMGKK